MLGFQRGWALATIGAGILAIVACNGGVASSDHGTPEDTSPCPENPAGGACADSQPDGSVMSSSSSSSSGNTDATTGRAPQKHRAVATACDGTRPDTEPNGIPDGGTEPNGYIECRSNAECTAGKNGRCNGNGHDGWHCTYDACQSDGDCKSGVCECEGGFRADNNACLPGNCKVDGDCGANGYCSPSQGDCGDYTGTVGYFCHGPQDECVDDLDCPDTYPAGSTCRFDKTVGHWKCSSSQCAG